MFESRKTTLILIVLIVAWGVLSQSVRIIPEGRTGVVFNLKGGVQDNALKEGIHFLIPFVQTLIVFDTRYQTYTFADKIASTRRTGPLEIPIGRSIEAKTGDGQTVNISLSLITRMIQNKAPEVYNTLKTDYLPTLKTKVSNIIRQIIARHVADALYTEETRKIVTNEALGEIAKSFSESGFELNEVLLRRIDFSPEYIEAIERKQIALQKAELAKIKKDIAIKDKKIEILKGEAQGQVVAIKGRAVQANPKVAELEFLEVLENSEERIPVITGLKGHSIISVDKLLTGGSPSYRNEAQMVKPQASRSFDDLRKEKIQQIKYKNRTSPQNTL